MAPSLSTPSSAGPSVPSTSAVAVCLAEPVVFLFNLDSATDRRERRHQRRREREQASRNAAAAASLASTSALPGGFGAGASFGPSGGALSFGLSPRDATDGEGNSSSNRLHAGHGREQDGAYVPPTGRGGAGSRSRSRSRSMNMSDSPNRTTGRSPSRGRASLLRSRDASMSRERGRSPAPPTPPPAAPPTTSDTLLGNGETADTSEVVVNPETADIDLLRAHAIIRGLLVVTLSKPTKVKRIGVTLRGVSRTEWPEGIGPRRLETSEKTTLIEEHVVFFDGAAARREAADREAPTDAGSRSRSASRVTDNGARSPSGNGRRSSSRGPLASSEGSAMSARQAPAAIPPASGHPASQLPPPPCYAPEGETPETPASSSIPSTAASHLPGLPGSSRRARALSPLSESIDPPNPASDLRNSDLAGSSRLPSALHVSGPPGASASSALSQDPQRASLETTSHDLELGTTPSRASHSSESTGEDRTSDPEQIARLDQRGRSSSFRPVRGTSVDLPAVVTGHGLDSPNTTVTDFVPNEGRNGSLRRFSADAHGQESTTRMPLDARAPSSTRPASALRHSSSTARSPSVSSVKSARFSLGTLIGRGKSSSRPAPALPRTASPDRMAIKEEEDSHAGRRSLSRSSAARGGTSRTRTPGLQAIKKALLGNSTGTAARPDSRGSSGHATDDSDDDTDNFRSGADSDEEGGHRGRSRNARSASSGSGTNWQELKAGTYSYPITIPLPPSLPPTIHAGHGSVLYTLKGFVKRAGALTSNLAASAEVHVVAAPNEDDLEGVESIIVERMWETQLSYKIVVHCKATPVGGEIPISVRLNPLAKMKLFRMSAIIEEKYTFYAKKQTVARSPNVKKYEILRIQYEDGSPLLPIVSDSPNALQLSPLRDWIVDPASTEGSGISTLDPLGPWLLESTLRVPDCASALHFSTAHDQANMTVVHSLKLCLRVERGDDEVLDTKGNRKKFDIIIDAPIHILSCRTRQAHHLPTYTTSPSAEQNALASGTDGSTSHSEAAFHPHELSEAERLNHAHQVRPAAAAQSHMPAVPLSAFVPLARNGTSHPFRAAGEAGQAGASASGYLPPPTYEYARAHPEESPAVQAPIHTWQASEDTEGARELHSVTTSENGSSSQ